MQKNTWFYSLLAPLTTKQVADLQARFDGFTNNWKSHGTPVNGKINIQYNQFVVAQSDISDERPSGCSIDSMRKAIETILKEDGLEWADAAKVFYKNGDNSIQQSDFRQIPQLLTKGEISAESVVFDHSLNNSDDLTLWERPMKETWLKRYL